MNICENYVLLIHGPFAGNCIDKISYQLQKAKNIPKEIVFVAYLNDKENYTLKINEFFKDFSYRIIYVKDLINPGFANINRHVNCVKSGLEVVDDNDFVIKLRNDQFFDFNKLCKVISKDQLFVDTKKRILTTNCFTRRDRLYHPSDMFLCGFGNVLKEYFSLPLKEDTHLDVEMKVIREYQNNKNSKIIFAPESEFFINFLKQNKWELKYTTDDSYNALKKYIYLINTWDIDLKWAKKRTNMFPKNSLVLPHYFKIEPFFGGPVERVSCFARHEFGRRVTIKDLYYLLLSKIVWSLWKPNRRSVQKKIKKFLKKIK